MNPSQTATQQIQQATQQQILIQQANQPAPQGAAGVGDPALGILAAAALALALAAAFLALRILNRRGS